MATDLKHSERSKLDGTVVVGIDLHRLFWVYKWEIYLPHKNQQIMWEMVVITKGCYQHDIVENDGLSPKYSDDTGMVLLYTLNSKSNGP